MEATRKNLRQTQDPVMSKHLLREAEKFLFYPQRMARIRTKPKIRNLYDEFRRTIVDWRKTFAPQPENDLTKMLSQPVFLDEFYCRELLKAVPDIVARTLSLSRLTLSSVSNSESFVYLHEAVNCYIVGLPQAAVALARAALEDALRKKAEASGQQIVARANLRDLINEHSQLSLEGRDLAHKVRSAANIVLHKRVAASQDAITIIEATRAVILELAQGAGEQREHRQDV